MALAPFPIQPELVAITIGYRNNRLIADSVLPRIPVGTESFKYLAFDKAEAFTVPDTKVGRKGKPNQVEFSATEQTASTVDHALDDAVPQADIENAASIKANGGTSYDPVGRAVEGVTDLLALDREVRTAALVFDANSYAAANKVTLAGTDQWSDFANSNPIDDIMAAIDACIMRPNKMVLGRAVYTKLCQHPKLTQAFFGTAAQGGIVPLDFIARLFELEEVLVGEGWVNTAKKGQAASFARVWGKHCALLAIDPLANAGNSRPTFGFSGQFGSRVAGAWDDKDIGMRGGQRVRVGESVKELVCANDLGYFIENAVV